jgi:three-Cys-motif partner protein
MDWSVAEPPSEYWREYSNLQRVKHDLIRHYLNGWFPKLILGGATRVVYLDTHAGRGRHTGGQLGSPLIALKTLMEHEYRDRLLAKSEIHFFFIEDDEASLLHLRGELTAWGHLPPNVFVRAEHGNCFLILEDAISSLGAGQRLAPSFVFCDPFTFKVPGSFLRRLMAFPRVELFVNVMWRELDMALANARPGQAGWSQVLNDVFGGPAWEETIVSQDYDERAEQCAGLLRRITGATWATYIRMLGDNQKTRYFLLHLTNHPAGRDLMKDCMWKACPEEGYYVRKTDDPKQQLLIKPEPDLSPLRDWVVHRLSRAPSFWEPLINEVRHEIWLPKHLNAVVRQLRHDKKIVADQYTGRFTPASNPRLRLATGEGDAE